MQRYIIYCRCNQTSSCSLIFSVYFHTISTSHIAKRAAPCCVIDKMTSCAGLTLGGFHLEPNPGFGMVAEVIFIRNCMHLQYTFRLSLIAFIYAQS